MVGVWTRVGGSNLLGVGFRRMYGGGVWTRVGGSNLLGGRV